MTECACKCHMERCSVCRSDDEAPSSDSVGETFCVDAQTRGMWEAPPTGEPKRASLLPDLSAMWARVFEEEKEAESLREWVEHDEAWGGEARAEAAVLEACDEEGVK